MPAACLGVIPETADEAQGAGDVQWDFAELEGSREPSLMAFRGGPCVGESALHSRCLCPRAGTPALPSLRPQ